MSHDAMLRQALYHDSTFCHKCSITLVLCYQLHERESQQSAVRLSVSASEGAGYDASKDVVCNLQDELADVSERCRCFSSYVVHTCLCNMIIVMY